MDNRYYDLNSYFRTMFGCRVQKITVDAGFSCPNRDGTLGTGGCIYCNAKGSGSGAHAQGLSVTEQLLKGKGALSRRYGAKKFIAYFQAFTNTYAPLPKLRALYTEALAVPEVVGLSIGTRPDCAGVDVLDLLGELAESRLVWIEYGLQSAHDATLTRIHRGHDVAAFERAVAESRKRKLSVCAHVILGLPGETFEDMFATARFLADADIQGIKLHLLYVVKGTPLEEMYGAGNYRCLEQEEYVGLVCRFLELLPPHLVIQRLTGDPHPEELTAPAWALKKTETLGLIRQRMEEENTRQGNRWVKTRTPTGDRPPDPA